MAERITKHGIRRRQVREQRAKVLESWHARLGRRLVSWPVVSGALFILATSIIVLVGEATLGYAIQQRIDHPIYARVSFRVANERQTALNREAAGASTPSYYQLNQRSLTVGRIRADLMRLYQAAADAETFEQYKKTLNALRWPADAEAYRRVHALGDAQGRAQFQSWVDELPLEKEYVVHDLLIEPRTPKSATDFIRLEATGGDGHVTTLDIPHAELVRHGNERALRRSAAAVARKFRLYALAPAVEAVVLAAFHDQPTVVFNRERTLEEIKKAEEATPVAMTAYEKGKPFIKPGVIGSEQYELLRAERKAYLAFLGEAVPEAAAARRERFCRLAGQVIMAGMISIGLLLYAGLHQRRVFEIGSRTLAFMTLILGTLLAVRLLDLRWPGRPELLYVPCLVAGSVLAIVYPRRFAMGAICIVAVLVGTVVNGTFIFMLILFTGVVVTVYQLNEIRSRTKLIASGAITAGAIVLASMAGGFWQGQTPEFVAYHSLGAGAYALLASFIVSGVLPLIEKTFRVATSLALLEWRDPTRRLLQLLAREAPGTYNHSLVLGTLAEAACERIGADGLLTQVGALYHDIGKIHKADYFVENQEGRISRHDNLAPTMSLLIILGHVKDGIEMAKEYKLPRVLHQFIEEHHGTTVVRYFHHMASEKQPRIASGKHDREVREAEFRYGGPKPRSRESAVLMLCDGVEGAVRALPEPTPSRIESLVHQVVTDRLNDGQFDDCEITLKQIRQVEDSLVKSLCGIYHGRVAYPKAPKAGGEEAAAQKDREQTHTTPAQEPTLADTG